MQPRLRRLVCGVLFCVAVLGASGARAQVPTPTRNAALRYWTAFALMKDSPIAAEVSALLGNVAEGKAAWNDSLSSILDDNADALETMRRATALPECDWGYEYGLGPRTPVGHLARARALARLNTVDGERLLAQGKGSEAVDVWLAGFRFSRHVAAGGPLVAALSGSAILESSTNALTQAVNSGRLDAASQRKIGAAVNALPVTPFDWASAIRVEQLSIDALLDELTQHPDRLQYYRRQINSSGSTEPLVLPSASATAAYRQFMTRYAQALAPPPDVSGPYTILLPDNPGSLDPFFQAVVPSGKRILDWHLVLSEERQALLSALAAARR